MAFSELSLPVTKKGYSRWAIFIVQEASEMSLPLNKFVAELAFITGCLVIFMIPLGLFFGERITRPIQKLYEATERFMAGDRDYKVDIKTGDEIEQFAIMFNDMLTDIGDKQARLENFSHDLEDKVEERTKKLSESQEATLNILEDLEDAKASLEKSNKELKKLDQLKSDFVSTVSHELRTPLSIIKEGVSLVIDKVPGDINEQQNKILEISKFNIDRLARIIDSLLDISKIDAGKVELKRSLINVADIAKQVAVSFEIKVREKGLELKLDVDDNAGMVYADSDRITQVFTNLVANAVKFTTSGYIAISCRPADDEIVCAVKDTGVGISKLDLPKIFDKFQQFGRLAGAGEKGTGLGLSIAKGIIDMHEGQISVESEPGKGSCFTFVLHKYTEASLFNDAVDRAIKTAAQSKAKVSIIRVSSRLKAGLAGQNLRANFHAAMIDGARSIKNTLRRQDDRVINNEGDMLIVLVNCSREHCAPVRARLEEILNKFFEERKLRNALDVQYGCATFPDDGRTSVELINKASAFAGHKRHA
jgi:signal transduction histidine kinase